MVARVRSVVQGLQDGNNQALHVCRSQHMRFEGLILMQERVEQKSGLIRVQIATQSLEELAKVALAFCGVIFTSFFRGRVGTAYEAVTIWIGKLIWVRAMVGQDQQK